MTALVNAYFNNPVIQGSINLFLLVLIVTGVCFLIIGHERRNDREKLHPWFGRYTVNIPNFMSYLRFPIGAFMCCIYFFTIFHTPFWNFIFHLCFALVCVFDYLDGTFARKWNAITEDGKSLDPASDKWVTFCLALLGFFYAGLRWWVLAIVVVREVLSMFQRARMRRKGEDVSAKWLGKVKTGVQFAVLYIVILRSPVLPGTIGLDQFAKMIPDGLVLWGMLLMCFCTIISLFPFYKTFSYVNDYKKSQKEECNKAWYILGIPNFFTMGNYLCGVTAVYFAMPEVHVDYRPFVVLFWIIAAGICDAIDGPMARKLKSYSDFGACLDSSVDLSTFGLATAIIISFRFWQESWPILGIVLGIIYFTFVHLRLARFTVLLNDNEDKTKKQDFVGMPSPSGSMGVMVAFTFFQEVWALTIAVLFLSWVMYSKLDFISHSNSVKHTIYKYVLIPFVLIGFLMLCILVFQQPFVSAHTSRELIIYFKICSWILFVPWMLYMLDAIWRTYIRKWIKGA